MVIEARCRGREVAEKEDKNQMGVKLVRDSRPPPKSLGLVLWVLGTRGAMQVEHGPSIPLGGAGALG
jgi:hypothetical protein